MRLRLLLIATALLLLNFTTYAQAPDITSFSPLFASTGETITITGTDFTGATDVTFGGTAAASFTVVSPTSITAVVASGTSGGVFVQTGGGSDTEAGFTYVLVPTITSFSPASGAAGATVTITGTNFNATPGNNFVFFGATQAAVTSANTTTLEVTVPSGATYQPITVATSGRIAFSRTPFLPTFTGGQGIVAGIFDTKVDFTASSAGNNYLAVGDLDADGKTDAVIANSAGHYVGIFRNTTASPGNPSFATREDISSGASTAPSSVAIGDLDGDGRPDLVITRSSSSSVAVFRNTTTSAGTITFDGLISFTVGSIPTSVAIGDFDGNGKPDLAVADGDGASILRNTSSGIGNINFATKISFGTVATPRHLAIGDLDGDGKSDIAVAGDGGGSAQVSVLRNTTSAVGTITFATKQDFATSQPQQVVIADLSADGVADLVVSCYNPQQIQVFHYNGTGPGDISYTGTAFTPGGGNATGLAMGDLDGDGRVDIGVTTAAAISLFRNTNSGSNVISLASAVNLSTSGGYINLAFGDLDGDARPDLMSTNATQISARRNLGDVTAPTVTLLSPLDEATGVAPSVNLVMTFSENVVKGTGNIVVREGGAGTITQTIDVTSGAVSISGNVVTIDISDFTSNAVSNSGANIQMPAGTFKDAAGNNYAGITFSGTWNFKVGVTLTSFTPTSAGAGTLLTLTGTGFFQLNTISIGGASVASWTTLSQTGVTAAVPSGATSGNIIITSTAITGNSTASLSGFTFIPAPTVSSFTPTAAAAGTTVTLTGTNFTNASSVKFGNTEATSFSVISPTSIEAVVAVGATGSVSVTTPGGNHSLAGFTFIPPPTVSSFTPTIAGPGATVTLTGTNFTTVAGGDATAVSFGGTAATSFTVVSATSIEAVVASGTSGSVSVTTAGGTGTQSGFTFVPAPTVDSFSPTTAGPGVTVTLTGTNFTDATAVSFGGSPASSFNVVSATSIEAVVAYGTSGSVSVTTVGGTGTLAGFTFPNEPAITSFSPESGAVGTSVTITGTDFDATPANNVVYFGATKAAVTDATATSLTVTVPAGATFQSISVLTNGMIAYSPRRFTPTFTLGSGIVSGTFAAKADFAITSDSEGVAVGDLDGDGKADVVITSQGDNSIGIFRNTSSGTANISFATRQDFSTVSNSLPRGIAIGDLDGDGRQDIVVAKLTGGISVFRNTTTSVGTITLASRLDFATGPGPYWVAIADFDGDGRSDVAVSRHSEDVVSVLPGTSSGPGNIGFGSNVDFATADEPLTVAVGDLNDDGKPDLAVACRAGDKISVFRNTSTGNGNFNFATKQDLSMTAPQSVAIGDLNGNGTADLAAVSYNGTPGAAVFRYNGSGGSISYAARVDITAGVTPTSVAIGDLDGDGKNDLAVSGQGIVSVFRNNTGAGANPAISVDGAVTFATSTNPMWVAIGDMDSDGRSDILATTELSVLSVLRNKGDVTAPLLGVKTPSDNATDIASTTNLQLDFTENMVKGTGNIIIREDEEIAQTIDVNTAAVSISGTIVTIDPANLTKGANVNIEIDAGVFTDASGNEYGGIADASEWNFVVEPPAPTISNFGPTSSGAGGTVTITGTNFRGATFDDASAVSFGGTAATSFTVVSSTVITAVVAEGTSGIVSVTGPGGTGDLAGFTFIPAPTMSSFAPTSAGAGTTVTITGTNFSDATAVSFGGTAATSFTVVSPTSITAVVASGTSGSVSVTTPGGTIALAGFTFIPAPTLSSFTPTSQGEGMTVTLTGTNFSGATAVSFGGTAATSFDVVSATSITAVVASGTSGSVSVTTPGGTIALAGFTFIPAPTLSSFNPTSAASGATVTLTGTNLTGATAVGFGGTAATSFNVESATSITAVVASGTSGSVSVTTPGGTVTLAGFIFIPAPTLSSFTPTSAASGATVTLTGTNLTGATAVSFGGTPATSFNVVSPTTIEALVASGSSGSVSVTTPGGLVTLAGFTFIPAPTLTSFDPTTAGPGMTVTLIGANLTNATAVSFGGTPATSFNVVSSTTIEAIVASGTTGSVSVTTPGGTYTEAGFRFVPAPILTSIDPTSAGAGATVTITGINLTDATAVSFGGTEATSFNVVSTTSIEAVVGPGTSGNVSVTTPGGTDATLAGFTFIPAPTLTSFNPASAGAGATVTLTGTNFTGATAVSFGGTAATSFSVISATSIEAVVASGASGSISVTTPGGTATLAGFTFIPAPTLTSFTPTSAGTTATVTLTGTNLTGATAVSFGGTAATSFNVISATSIEAVVASGASGSVSVTTPGGTATLAGFVFIPAPTLTSFNPASAGAGATVTLTGTNFTGASAVSFGGTAATSFNVISATSIEAVVASGASGSISVTTPGGTATLAGFVFIPAPTLTSFNPASAGAGATVTLTGTNFTGATAVSFGGTAATSFNVVSPTSITAVVAAGTSGNISVTTPGGTATLGGFSFIPAPVLTSFTPTSAGEAVTVTLTGTDFTDATAVSFGGTAATSFNVDSPTSITAVVSSGASGDVSVTTPGGTTTLAGFTFILAPTLTSFNPATARTGATITLTGTNFTGATVVTFGGTAAASFNVDSPSSITAVLAAGSSGTVSVTTGGGQAGLNGFTFVPPTAITNINPNSGPVGTSVTITGNSFSTTAANNTVKFNGVAATITGTPTTTSIVTTVPSGATTGPITVETEGETATSSNFTVTPPDSPTITGFSPTVGPIGTTVTITGTNFSTTAVNNTVKFNGVAAAITGTPTSTSIVTTVPSGATTGTITVEVNGLTAGSSTQYIVANAPAIASFSPESGPVGTTITITGTDFSSTLANNTVYFGANKAAVSSATSTSLTVTVPVGATFQPISVFSNGLVAYGRKPFLPTFPGGSGIVPGTFGPRYDFAAGAASQAAAVGDLDGDGKSDVVASNQNDNTIGIFRNTSTGSGNTGFATREDISTGPTSFPGAVVIADLDGDGKQDIVVSRQTGGVSVFRNTSSGAGNIAFAARQDFTAGTNPGWVAVSDLDGDGKSDLVAANYGSASVSILRGTGSGPGNINFAAKVDFTTAADPRSLAIGDLDGDGKPDLAVTCKTSNMISILRSTSTGDGNINFAPKLDFSGALPTSVAIGDLNGNGTADLAVTNLSANTVSVFRYNGTGAGNISYAAKVDFATGNSPTSVTMGDLDGDGKIDLAIANETSQSVSVLRNTNTGTSAISFAGAVNYTTSAPSVAAIGDVDGDGRGDLVVSTLNGFLSILSNNGDVTAPQVSAFSPLDNATGVSVSSNLVLTFDENVVKGTGNIVVREGGDLTQSIAVSSSSVTISGTVVTINPSNFTEGAAVNIEIAPGAFTDIEGNDYAGIADATVWNFDVVVGTPPAPTITSFNPASSASGGTVTITGTNFMGATAVSFGGTPATSFNIVSATSITAVVAAGASGDVSVTAPGGTVTLAGFTFLPTPTLTSFNPTSAGAGATVTLTGTNFTGATAVSFGGTSATSFAVVSATSITAVVAAGTSGSVSVTAPGGVASLGGFTFVPSPTLTSFTPTSAGAGATVTLTGTNFSTATAVTFGGTPATAFNVVSSTSITAVVGSGGTGTVAVSSPGGLASLAGFTFIPAPTLASFTPNSAVTGATVTLTGTNFIGATSVKFGGTEAASFNVVSSTSITAVLASGSSGSVSVTTPGGMASLSGFTFVPTPSITNINPNSGPIGTPVTITGTNFSTTAINNTVKFNGVLATITGTPTATSIVTAVPIGATTGTITVEVNGLTATSPGSFTVTAPNSPTITGLNPSSGIIGTSVTITGSNFSTTAVNNIVKFNGVTATITGTPTATSIVATVPAGATTGIVTVEVNGLTATSSSNFTVTLPNTPTISGFNPVTGSIGASVTITGTNFSTTASDNVVRFNGVTATITGTPTATSIVTTVPAGATTGVITVEVNGQTATSSSDFTVTPPNSPTITGFSPASGIVGTSVTITGTNFSTTAANNIVRFNGVIATITGTPTATSIVTTVPAGATTGVITVEVNGQTATSSSDFTVTPPNSPTITGFSPASGIIGTSVTITGTNFSTTAANNIVRFNGVVATITGTPTSTSIVAAAPTGATTGIITVEVGGQTATSATNFTVIPASALPTIASFNPTSGAIGTSVTITGTNFSTTAGNNIVRFNGALATVTGTPTATSITTAVPIGATTGKLTVEVAGQTATSSADFTVTTVTLVQITNVTFPSSFTKGSSMTVSITVNDASKVTSVALMTRGISEASSAAKSTVITGAGNKYEKVIEPADLADPIGLVYFYEVVDLNGVKISSAVTNAYPIFSSTSTEQVLPGLSFGNQVSDYQIIAFPFAFTNNAATSVLGALGTYDKTKWRLFDFVAGDNREYPAFTTIDPGKGYWLIVKNTVTINPGAGQTVAAGSAPFTIPIVAGWNLIGNPYNFRVSWDDIRAANTDIAGLEEKVQVFSGGGLTEVSVIDKFRGAFIFSNSAGSLKIPVTRNTTIGGRTQEIESGRFAIDQPHWEVPLKLTDGVLTNALGGIGMHPNATLVGKDLYDNVSVPLPDGLTLFELAAAHPEVHATFSRDVVPTAENFKWKFDVKGTKGKRVELRWDNSYFGNNDKELVLFDPSTMELIDMRSTDHHAITDRVSEIAVLFGSREFIEEQLDEHLPVLGTPYPVPAHSEVTIPFRVPRSTGMADVKVRIYDAKGVLVDTPVDKVMAPGSYEVKCHPHSGTGLYIVRMEVAGKPSEPVKIIIN